MFFNFQLTFIVSMKLWKPLCPCSSFSGRCRDCRISSAVLPTAPYAAIDRTTWALKAELTKFPSVLPATFYQIPSNRESVCISHWNKFYSTVISLIYLVKCGREVLDALRDGFYVLFWHYISSLCTRCSVDSSSARLRLFLRERKPCRRLNPRRMAWVAIAEYGRDFVYLCCVVGFPRASYSACGRMTRTETRDRYY